MVLKCSGCLLAAGDFLECLSRSVQAPEPQAAVDWFGNPLEQTPVHHSPGESPRCVVEGLP
jgi:hypothetical protein